MSTRGHLRGMAEVQNTTVVQQAEQGQGAALLRVSRAKRRFYIVR